MLFNWFWMCKLRGFGMEDKCCHRFNVYHQIDNERHCHTTDLILYNSIISYKTPISISVLAFSFIYLLWQFSVTCQSKASSNLAPWLLCLLMTKNGKNIVFCLDRRPSSSCQQWWCVTILHLLKQFTNKICDSDMWHRSASAIIIIIESRYCGSQCCVCFLFRQ